MRCGIVIPAYKEENRIKPTLEEYGKFFTERSKIWLDTDFQILVSVNGPKDGTINIIKEMMIKYPIIRYIYTSENGKGNAVKLGFDYFIKEGTREYIGFVDADNSTDPNEYFKLFLRCFLLNKNIIANRYDKESILNPPPGIKRRLASRTFNFIVRSLFPSLNVRDSQCGAKVFLACDMKKVVSLLTMTQWAFDVELLLLLNKAKCKVIEVPTTWTSKDYSHITLGGTSLKMLFSLFRLRLVHSPFKGFIRLYNKIPERYKFHHYV
jgi:glycosyltransferase involved in cell wall biosynthesis